MHFIVRTTRDPSKIYMSPENQTLPVCDFEAKSEKYLGSVMRKVLSQQL